MRTDTIGRTRVLATTIGLVILTVSGCAGVATTATDGPNSSTSTSELPTVPPASPTPSTSSNSLSPNDIAEQVAANIAFVQSIIEHKYGQSFAPEDILAAANSIDIKNFDGPSVFGIQEIAYPANMSVAEAIEVYNSYVARESGRILNLLIQSRGLQSTVPIPQPFSGVVPAEHFDVQDLILLDARERFSLRGVNEAILIDGVAGTPDGILQHIKTLADDDRITQYDYIGFSEITPQEHRDSGYDGVDITAVTPTEVAGSLGVVIDINRIRYASSQYLATEDYKTSGLFSQSPGITGNLLQATQGLAYYTDANGNLKVELTGYGAYTSGS